MRFERIKRLSTRKSFHCDRISRVATLTHSCRLSEIAHGLRTWRDRVWPETRPKPPGYSGPYAGTYACITLVEDGSNITRKRDARLLG